MSTSDINPSEFREKQILGLKKHFQNSLERLSLQKNLIEQLDKIPEEEPEKRIEFIKEKIEKPLEKNVKNLKEGEYGILPSIQGKNSFNFILKIGAHYKKLTGALKKDGFELMDYEGKVVKSIDFEKCLEKVVLSFEKHLVIPIVYMAHQEEVFKASKNILELAFENHAFDKVQKIFSYLNLKEIESSSLLFAFEKGSEDIIQFLLHKLSEGTLQIKERSKETTKKMAEKTLEIARHRAAHGDQHNLNISHLLQRYLAKQTPEILTQQVLEEEQIKEKFYKTILDLYALKQEMKDFFMRREKLEQTLSNTLEFMIKHNIQNQVLNQKVGDFTLHPLDVVLIHGTPNLLKLFLKAGAMPTVGWKYENLENFKQGRRSTLHYILSRSDRNNPEKKEISEIIEAFLKEKEAFTASNPSNTTKHSAPTEQNPKKPRPRF